MRYAPALALALLTLAALAGPAHAGLNRWTPADDDDVLVRDRAFSAVAVDPSGAGSIYAATFAARLFKSSDGGATWAELEPGDDLAGILSLAVDPVDPRTIWVGTVAGWILRSTDGGDTWLEVAQGEPQGIAALAVTPAAVYAGDTVTGVYRSRDGGDTWEWVYLLPGHFLLTVEAIPEDPQVVYASVYGEGILRSDDGGDTWQVVNADLAEAFVEDLAIDPAAPETVWAAAPSGVLRSDDRGRTWRPASRGLPELGARTLLLDPARSGTLYAGTARGVYRSIDGGETWWPLAGGPGRGDVRALAVLEHDAAVQGRGGPPSTLYAGTALGLWRLDPVTTLALQGGRFEVEVAWREHGGIRGAGSVVALPDADKSPDRLPPISRSRTTSRELRLEDLSMPALSRSASRLTLSVVLGAAALAAPLHAGANRWTPADPHGTLPEAVVYPDLAVDSSGAGTIYASGSGGLFKSSDGGATWEDVTPEDISSAFSTVALDRLDPRTVWAAGVSGKLFRSDDGGETWMETLVVPHGIPAVAALGDTVFVGGGRFGIRRSLDGGVTWELVYETFIPIPAVAIDPEDPQVVYAAALEGGVLKSDDGGSTWRTVLEEPGLSAQDLAIDPRSPQTLWAATDMGVWRSDDGGSTWRSTSRGLPPFDVTELALDPLRPGTLYAGTDGRGVYRSIDGGETWWPLPGGFPGGQVRSLAFGPHDAGDPAALYAGFGFRGLWRNDPVTGLALQDGRFEVAVDWLEHGGVRGAGSVVTLDDDAGGKGGLPLRSRDSAVLEFFDDENWELLVKVLDGRALNDRFWVFAAAATDVEYALTVTDTACGDQRVYENPLGRAAPALTDTDAFPGCDVPGPPACVGDDDTVCLGEGGRFAVELAWRDYRDRTGAGRLAHVSGEGLAASDDSGLFFFFNGQNWELLAKVLDGCSFNGRYWVFAAASTDVAYDLTVRDVETGAVQTYSNPLGQRAAALTDTDAFGGCDRNP